jgi:hypothetical protein
VKTKQKFPKVGRVASESVEKHTARGWDEWIFLLDKAGARLWTHQEIVAHLKKKYKLTPWWQQGVTVGYEIAIGRRVENQDQKGLWSLTATKNVACDGKKLFRILLSEEGQKLWLNPLDEIDFVPKKGFETHSGYFGEVRTVRPPKAVRLTLQEDDWEKPSVVELMVVARPGKKSIVAFGHTKIPTQKLQIEFRTYWKSALEKIKAAVEGDR